MTTTTGHRPAYRGMVACLVLAVAAVALAVVLGVRDAGPSDAERLYLDVCLAAGTDPASCAEDAAGR